MPPSSISKVLNTLQITNDFRVRPAGLKWRSNTIFIIATVAIGLFTDLFLYGLIVPILPFMLEDRVGLPKDQLQANVSGLLAAYAGSSVLFSPIAGILADKLKSRQGPFLVGLLALLGATVMLFLGRSIPMLAAARVLQGISGAFVWTIGLALCLETVGPANLGKTIGSIFSFTSVGTLAAPPLGGVLYKKAGYPGVFGIAFAILVIDFIMRALVIEKKVALKYEAQDPSSVGDLETTPQEDNDGNTIDQEQALPTEDQPLLTKQNSKGGDEDDKAAWVFSPDQPRIARAIPILPCLADPRLLTAFFLAFVQAAILGGFDATIPIVSNKFFGFDSLQAGILFLPLGAFDLILGPAFGYLVDRFGTKPVAVVSYAYLVPILVLLRLPHEGGQGQIILYGAVLALCGIGLAGIGAPSLVESGAIVQKYFEANPEFFGENGPYAQLYGLGSMVFCAGLTVGPELAGMLTESIGYGNMNAVLATICAVTCVLSFFYIGGKPKIISRKG
ncbi:MFS general substrate transporter [Polychaeton citri CBS 116435]|uniref:MFS general substrate transporter n=1 Tax=Polychaeton citri CBS 116435 TaxID=1314669 RepID=A0A9P4QFC6_9PEZI|nr:MFS general substrate transporter [Polychaeton citri CBS 116435]